jgi:hypothetical protein
MAAENILVIAISNTSPERDVRNMPANMILVLILNVGVPSSDNLLACPIVTILFF